ncbi:glycosyl transferase family 51 [Vogesella sp. EB]|uniref:transglycosylase domain-containing protein n=1 Tax=Vogesella sp. EB TaxID=1526735 RepID=UPI00064D066F|nr:transglycosylase domain-containing protein [Vogesella sp. EB]KMJ53429.1 glycosyl transferase family 51 [Vogesella sp. EB]
MDNSDIQLKKGNGRGCRYALWSVGILLLLLIGGLLYLLLDELQHSRQQARFFSDAARDASFQVKAGPSQAIRFPTSGGPYDQRLGYTAMPGYLQRLQARGYAIASQAELSDGMLALADHGVTAPLLPLGLFLPYHEKDQTGLTLTDGYGQTIYQSRTPQRVYADFNALPSLLVGGLLYIENRTLLEKDSPQRNPAVDWSRFSKALVDKALHLFDSGYRAAGASTLATQIEKYRHSPAGRTSSDQEKLRQMLSASVRAYLDGEDTTAARRRLVVKYLNTVPLAARAGFGEVSGIGDGMWAWYGRDFAQVNRALTGASVPVAERAVVFKEALSLMIAQRSPSIFLNGDMKVLEAMTDAYLRMMARDKLIPPALRDAALRVSLRQQRERVRLPVVAVVAQKGVNAVRIKLAGLLGVRRMYDLDRLDLAASSTLDLTLQQQVTAELLRLRDPEYARAANLNNEYLLQQGSPQGVTYSFTLIERTPTGNKVRVQADNFAQPFDINEGAKLDLGSTAKLRTLVSYLMVVHELHQQYAALGSEQLAAIRPSASESVLRRWAIDYLVQATDSSLTAMLEAALERTYSASPGESFFTAGGLHTFNNFDENDDSKTLTVREATRRSVNLVYIRLMRDIARYYMQPAAASGETADEDDDTTRREYLQRFADREGRTFLAGFYNKYRHKSAEEIDALLVARARQSPKKLAVIFRSIRPEAGLDAFTAFLARHLDVRQQPDAKTLARLYDELGPQRFNLNDRGYLAGVHPLELWLVAYLHQHPDADWSELVRASTQQRQEVYQWLLNSKNRAGQASRIRAIKEIDAFKQIHKGWKRLGYPFDALVPSYATALGASADRPASLAELMGILSNDGVRLPTVYLDKLHFAAGTPYETSLTQTPAKGERVLPAEVAQVVRRALAEVVELGTARRVAGAFDLADGTRIPVGGKTGTGDHRFKVFARGGALLSERVVSRAGAFAFYIGDRYFGTLIAYVAGPQAGDYRFTSALPVQVLKILAPTLRQRLELKPG